MQLEQEFCHLVVVNEKYLMANFCTRVQSITSLKQVLIDRTEKRVLLVTMIISSASLFYS